MTIKITVPFEPSLATCPECGFEQEFGSGYGKASCRNCDYHAGSDMAQHWLDYCEKLTAPDGMTIDFCHEAENVTDYWIEVTGSKEAITEFATKLDASVTFPDFDNVLEGSAHICADGTVLRAMIPAHFSDDPEADNRIIVDAYPEPAMPNSHTVLRIDRTDKSDATVLQSALAEKYSRIEVEWDT